MWTGADDGGVRGGATGGVVLYAAHGGVSPRWLATADGQLVSLGDSADAVQRSGMDERLVSLCAAAYADADPPSVRLLTRQPLQVLMLTLLPWGRWRWSRR